MWRVGGRRVGGRSTRPAPPPALPGNVRGAARACYTRIAVPGAWTLTRGFVSSAIGGACSWPCAGRLIRRAAHASGAADPYRKSQGLWWWGRPPQYAWFASAWRRRLECLDCLDPACRPPAKHVRSARRPSCPSGPWTRPPVRRAMPGPHALGARPCSGGRSGTMAGAGGAGRPPRGPWPPCRRPTAAACRRA